MNEMHQMAAKNGGTVSQVTTRRTITPDSYRRIVSHYARDITAAVFVFSLGFTSLASYLIAKEAGAVASYTAALTYAPYTVVCLITAVTAAYAARLWALAARWQTLENSTKQTKTEVSYSPPGAAPAPTVTVTSARGRREVPTARKGAGLADEKGNIFQFSGKRLDELETQPLTRKAQKMSGTLYQQMIDALKHNGYAAEAGGGYQWTEAGERWRKTAGLPYPDSD